MCVVRFVDDTREVLVGQLSLDVASHFSTTTYCRWE